MKSYVLILSRSANRLRAIHSGSFLRRFTQKEIVAASRHKFPPPGFRHDQETASRRSFHSALGSLFACDPTKSASKAIAETSSHRASVQGENEKDDPDTRRELLNACLARRRIDAAQLEASLLQSMDDPSSGYDSRFGKSALKAYRSFLYPKAKAHRESDSRQPRRQQPEPSLASAAHARAQQIDFLMQRHIAHQVEWVRNHDASRPEALAESKDRTAAFPIVLVLDNVRSAFNVGSLFRTADAAGCEAVVTVGVTPHPSGSGREKLRKSGLGAEAVVPSVHFDTIYDAFDHFEQTPRYAGYEIVALETTERSVLYSDYSFSRDRGVIIILGNEVTGGRPEVLSEKVDQVLEIPMFGAKNSLNVAACAPVVLFEILRQWNAGTNRDS
jgi:23S rRNA (guanosine2251-2'-O)-methyltransferase